MSEVQQRHLEQGTGLAEGVWGRGAVEVGGWGFKCASDDKTQFNVVIQERENQTGR